MNLKIYLIACFVSILLSACSMDREQKLPSLSSSEKDTIVQSITSVMDMQTDCWNNGRIECFTSYYADTSYSCIMGSKGPICGRDSITAVYLSAYPAGEMGELRFENISIHVLDKDIALVRGKFILEYPDKPMDSGWYTLVFQKIKGKWLIIADQTG